MNIKSVIILLLGLSLGTGIQAQNLSLRNANQARKIIRLAKPTADEQKKTITEVEKLIKTIKMQPDSTEYYLTTGILRQYQLQIENNKLYYNNKPDTVTYFTRLYEMVSNYQQCFPALDAKKGEAKEIRSVLQNNCNNLRHGANFFLLRHDLNKAYQYFYKYIELAEKQLVSQNDSLLHRAYYNTMFVASKKEDYPLVVQLFQASIKHGVPTEDTDLLYCDALYRQGLFENWIEAVKYAIQRHPDQFYFYASLIDYYISHGQSDSAVQYAEELQTQDPKNAFKNFVQGYVYQQMGRYSMAVDCLERAYQIKADIPQNLSSLGFCYVAMAEEYTESLRGRFLTAEERGSLNKYYSTAQLYLERCRQLMPDSSDYWAPALYKVYYNLNMGKEMEEIERLVGK